MYGERKGAAYGLAGLVKGLGILYLKQLNIMSTLQDAIQDKKNFRHREGALFAYEMLCTMLGRLFEPYVVHVLPNLLLCFGDGNQYVREVRTQETALPFLFLRLRTVPVQNKKNFEFLFCKNTLVATINLSHTVKKTVSQKAGQSSYILRYPTGCIQRRNLN